MKAPINIDEMIKKKRLAPARYLFDIGLHISYFSDYSCNILKICSFGPV